MVENYEISNLDLKPETKRGRENLCGAPIAETFYKTTPPRPGSGEGAMTAEESVLPLVEIGMLATKVKAL